MTHSHTHPKAETRYIPLRARNLGRVSLVCCEAAQGEGLPNKSAIPPRSSLPHPWPPNRAHPRILPPTTLLLSTSPILVRWRPAEFLAREPTRPSPRLCRFEESSTSKTRWTSRWWWTGSWMSRCSFGWTNRTPRAQPAMESGVRIVERNGRNGIVMYKSLMIVAYKLNATRIYIEYKRPNVWNIN